MRKIFFLLFTIGCALELSAQEEVVDFYFSAPQPSGVKDLKEIPESFCGEYRSAKDSLVTLNISGDSVWLQLISVVMMTLDEIRQSPSLRLEDSLLYGIYRDKPVEVLRKNDTLFFGIESTQRMFAFSDTSRLRVCGNDLLMSWQEKKGQWTVMRIRAVPRTAQSGPAVEFSFVDQSEELQLMEAQKNLKRKKSGNQLLLQLDLNAVAMQNYITGGGFTMKQIYFRKIYH